MKLAEIKKALAPLVGILLTWAANLLGVADGAITAEVASMVTGLLVAIAAAVFKLENKPPAPSA